MKETFFSVFLIAYLKILKGKSDSIPSTSVKIQIMGGKYDIFYFSYHDH